MPLLLRAVALVMSNGSPVEISAMILNPQSRISAPVMPGVFLPNGRSTLDVSVKRWRRSL